MKRRSFILRAGATLAGLGTVLAVGWGVMPPRGRLGSPDLLPVRDDALALNGWVRIQSDGKAVLAMPRSEMGQGVFTGLTTLLAEELDLALDHVVLEQAPDHAIYGNVAMLTGSLPFHPLQVDSEDPPAVIRATEWIVAKVARELGLSVTGGSSSLADAWTVVRLAGASARGALLAAAANRWGVDPSQLQTENGRVLHADGRQLGYGELAAEAARIPTALEVAAKPGANWHLIGQPARRIDVPEKVDGTARFGIDVRLPGMVFAAVNLCPTLGGRLRGLNRDELQAMPGVIAVVPLEPLVGTSGGFAVVASHTWHAQQAALKARADWDHGPNHMVKTSGILREMDRALQEESGFTFYSLGDVEAALDASPNRLEASYEAPHLAHATLEPMNATAWFQDDMLEIWAPTQVPGLAARAAAQAAGVSGEQVRLHVTMLGGGFGRRLESDFVAQAAAVARALPGRPVQLVWSREQDMTHDFYRPAQVARLQAGIDRQGRLQALKIRSAGDSIVDDWIARSLPVPGGLPDKTTAEGLFDQAYGIANQSMSHVKTRSGVPVGFWRSVGHSHAAFFIESFIDEIANALAADPLDYRLSLLENAPRHAAVLRLARDKSDWGRPLPTGMARGVALHESFGSVVAQVAEVSISDGELLVHQVTCAIDCGIAVNPTVIAQQMEGGVVFGLTAALHGRIDIQGGQVRQQNFPDYPLLPMSRAPRVTTHIVPSNRSPSGVGEPGVPPIAPAVGNALFALTGSRLRRLPLKLG